MMTREEFAALLKDFRRREEVTQETAAAFLGVSLRTWQNWEIARNMPRGFGLRALVLALQNSSPGTNRAPHSPPGNKAASRRAAQRTEPAPTPVAPPGRKSVEGAPSHLEAHLL